MVGAGCKKPYNPPVVAAPASYLVVEGIINAGSDSTVIKINRTVNISSGVTKSPEKNALVSIQSSADNTYQLTEISNGIYATAGLNLDVTKTYRLSIKTSGNQQYFSDYVPVKNTPPIDSIGFTVQADGIQLYVNTHDPNNSTRYYLWNYVETWQFHAKFFSSYITNGTDIVLRTPNQMIYTCFASDLSSSIILGSSAKLSQDVIYQSPLGFVPSTSEKLETKYSILVREYALTSEEYTFWTNLKKNTEQLGSIFDAEPSNINGNIHNVSNPSEPVIGYVGASTVQSKRVFISNTQLPPTWATIYPYDCQLDSDYFDKPKTIHPENQVLEYLIPLGSGNIPIAGFTAVNSPILLGYTAAGSECVDCTLRGTNKQPSFWQ
jgi:hypothetical protein